MTLTETQQEFAEANHNLIHHFAFKNHLDIDEYYDILAIALCEAVCKFDKAKGYAFSTFAFSCMRNKTRNYLRNEKRKIENNENILSIDYTYQYDLEGQPTTLENLLQDRTVQIEDSAVNKRLCEQFSKTLNQRHKKVFKYMIMGYNQREIAHHINLTYARVNQIVKRIREKWIQFTSEGE